MYESLYIGEYAHTRMRVHTTQVSLPLESSVCFPNLFKCSLMSEATTGGGATVLQPTNTRDWDWVGTELRALKWPKPLLGKPLGSWHLSFICATVTK